MSLLSVELRVGDFCKIHSSVDSHCFLYGSPTALSALPSHSLPPFSRQQCWSLSSWLSCCTLIFNRPLLLLHLVCGLWTLCGSAAGNSEWVGNLKQKRLCISTGLRFELCSALDTCSWFSGLWFKCRFAGVSVKLKSVLRNWLGRKNKLCPSDKECYSWPWWKIVGSRHLRMYSAVLSPFCLHN